MKKAKIEVETRATLTLNPAPPTVTLKLETVDNEIRVVDAVEDWTIVGFRVVDGKINLVKYSGIGGRSYNTNSRGVLEETEK